MFDTNANTEVTPTTDKKLNTVFAIACGTPALLALVFSVIGLHQLLNSQDSPFSPTKSPIAPITEVTFTHKNCNDSSARELLREIEDIDVPGVVAKCVPAPSP